MGRNTHTHEHGPDCGHLGIKHDGHVAYVHNGHLHHQRSEGTAEEHKIPVSEKNPDDHNPISGGGGHGPEHFHNPGCGHEAVPHGDHTCYIVGGRLHHPHGDHCDDHGPVEIVQEAGVR